MVSVVFEKEMSYSSKKLSLLILQNKMLMAENGLTHTGKGTDIKHHAETSVISALFEEFDSQKKYFEAYTNDQYMWHENNIAQLLSLIICLYMLIMIHNAHRYSIVLPRDGLWGSQDENGTWTGIVKDLQDKVRITHYHFI